MRNTLEKIAGRTSLRFQQSLKRLEFARQISRGVFRSDEPEYARLEEFVREGDWVIDVGANIGHYTLRLSNLVKTSGRVLAFEPIPLTFELLAASSALSPHRNVTLFNVAVSDRLDVVTMEVPTWEQLGTPNFYEAHITTGGSSANGWSILSMGIDSLEIRNRVSFIKIDAEGHEVEVVRGMIRLIERDRPVLVLEGNRAGSLLESLGFVGEQLPGSPDHLLDAQGETITVLGSDDGRTRPVIEGSGRAPGTLVPRLGEWGPDTNRGQGSPIPPKNRRLGLAWRPGTPRLGRGRKLGHRAPRRPAGIAPRPRRSTTAVCRSR
ncbi:MAG: FkbM family methyltransferase [Isosphaeraceae bacterium]|nr:FkbM family methyltransferase [Isosphaeraceae bacterium]